MGGSPSRNEGSAFDGIGNGARTTNGTSHRRRTGAGGAEAGAGVGAGGSAAKAHQHRGALAVPPSGAMLRSSSTTRVLQDEAKEGLSDYYEVKMTDNRLGRGHYGIVRKGVQIGTGLDVAVKTIRKSRVRNVDMIRNEIRILRKLRHPNVVKLYDVFEDDDSVHLVMELCSGGELFERIQEQQRYDEQSAAILIKTVLMAVDHCHSHGIVHRDLKPENFLFTSTNPDAVLKIIDFGLSCSYTAGQVLTSRVGTPYYIAPEVLEKHYSCECDIWSVGVILYILLCGYPPFWGDRDQDIFRKVRKGVVSFASVEWEPVSDRAKELVAGLLTSNPRERLTAKEALRHPWIVAEGGQHVKAISSALLANMHKFALARMIKRVALNIIVQLVDETDLEELQEVFLQITRQTHGVLTLERFHSELKSCKHSSGMKESRILMKALNVSGSGNISMMEFCAACLRRAQYLSEPLLYDAFVILDADSTGYITAANIQHVIGLSPEQAQRVVDEADVNEEGHITYADYLRAMFGGGTM